MSGWVQVGLPAVEIGERGVVQVSTYPGSQNLSKSMLCA